VDVLLKGLAPVRESAETRVVRAYSVPAYVIVDVDVRDPEAYKEYRARAAPTVAAAGGRYLVRGGAVEHVEPGWDLHRFVILEFPSVEAARRWYASPAYQEVLPIRLRSTRSRLAIVEGLDPSKPLPP
jgi:uncharacterized protein (DUF1330 family)